MRTAGDQSGKKYGERKRKSASRVNEPTVAGP